MATWSTSDMKQDGHAEWVVRVAEKVVNTMRSIGGLPEVTVQGYMVIKTPDLITQAKAMNRCIEDPPEEGLQPYNITTLND